MLSKEDIKNITKFNLSIVQEALRQAEQRLNDCFNKKENLEKKAFTLLPVFLSFSTALFSVPKILNVEEVAIYLATILTGICFFFGAIFLFQSLKALDYGTLGRYPDTWLQQGILNGDDDMKAYVLANVLYDYQTTIGVSDKSNEKKIKLVNKGIVLGIFSPILFLLCLFVSYLQNITPHLFVLFQC